MRLRLALKRGDLSRQASASVLVTSANDSLIGNEQPLYWRFASRKSVDGAIRAAAGPELSKFCIDNFEAREPIARGPRRDISRWEQTAKRGNSAIQRCAPGDAVLTPAFALDADHLIHVVAPDSEFMYQGYFQGTAGNRGGDTGIRLESSPPLDLLRACYEKCWYHAQRLRAPSIALPSLGSGVKAWRPAISCALAIDTLLNASSSTDHPTPEVTFVLGDDAAAIAWTRMATTLLGPPHILPAVDRTNIPLQSKKEPYLLALWEFADLASLPSPSISQLKELTPKPPAKSGWAGDHWKPTSNGW